MDTIIAYIVNHYDPGIIIIFIAILYIYISSLNKLSSVVLSKDDKDEILTNLKDINNLLIRVDSSIDTSISNLSSTTAELDSQVIVLSNTINEIIEKLKDIESLLGS